MHVLLLILIPYIFLCTALEWSIAIVLTSSADLRVYDRLPNARHFANLYFCTTVWEENWETVPEKPISIH